MRRHKNKIELFEKEIVNELKKLFGGKETIIKLRRKDSDRNEIVDTADKVVDYCLMKGGYK